MMVSEENRKVEDLQTEGKKNTTGDGLHGKLNVGLSAANIVVDAEKKYQRPRHQQTKKNTW